jgi:hypothetical protein
MRQVALGGSALVGWDAPLEHDLRVAAGGEEAVASHFIAAFGPRHAQVNVGANVAQTDALAQRRWERQRESEVAIAHEAVREMEATVAKQSTELREQTKQFEDWRTYIHELERELGRPLSGSPEAMALEQQHGVTTGADGQDAPEPAEPRA